MELFFELFNFFFAAFLAALFLLIIGYFIYKKISNHFNKKSITYINRRDGKTRIVKDRNGNIIKVDNIKEL